ncbi:MAG: M1 family metallopeptidase, partial [Bacteroidota bacterium]
MTNRNLIVLAALLMMSFSAISQQQRWQQKVSYKMDIEMDVDQHQYHGKQELVYTNNSPEVLDKVFYHLYFNAFQPGSMMDVRSRTIVDPDSRVGDRIVHLTESEQGWIKVNSLKINGKRQDYIVEGTILEVPLRKPIQPGETVTFDMDWDAQVPLQVRRSGWNNKEGIEFSMSQWYPKISEYDYEGWHSNPYVGREFHGVWGDFEVNITLPSNYVIAGTGELQNPDEIGYGYSDAVESPVKSKPTWKFLAKNVIDFVWAADPDYIQRTAQVENGPLLRFFFQPNEEYNEAWDRLPEFATKAFGLLSENFGQYPYSQYSIIQGGDGGMEYPMATLITGNRSLRSLVGVTVHEAAHSWYQGVLA